MNDELTEYARAHRFTRETFIKDVTMFVSVMNELYQHYKPERESNWKPFIGQRLKVKLSDVLEFTDLQLIKAHKFYWSQL